MLKWNCRVTAMGTRVRWLQRVTGMALVCLAMVLLSGPAFSQNCALCYTQASASGSRMIDALRSGILILVIPPTLMWLLIARIAYSKRNRFKHTENSAASAGDW
jgi:hypothetical protein